MAAVYGNIEALTSAVVSTLVLKCSGFPLPSSPRPQPQPHILTDGILLETDYEPKHFRLGSSLVHNPSNDSCATLLFCFFPFPFRFTGECRKTSAGSPIWVGKLGPTYRPRASQELLGSLVPWPGCCECEGGVYSFNSVVSCSLVAERWSGQGSKAAHVPGQTMLLLPLRCWLKGDLVLAHAHPLEYIFKYRSSLVIIPSSASLG